jgi:hypothetical protein
MKLKSAFLIIAFLIFTTVFYESNAQIKKENIKLGITYGTGSQNKFPFNLKDYSHDVTFYKAQINYKLKQKNNWTYEFNLEPSYNVAEHQLLNKWFIKPSDAENYEALRVFHTQKRTIHEYVLNLGLIVRYSIYEGFSTYAIGSVGPMIADKATERLAKGYAFSDVFGLGLSYKFSKLQLDYRYSVRHTSNLEMKKPNNGHNTTNMEFSVLFSI